MSNRKNTTYKKYGWNNTCKKTCKNFAFPFFPIIKMNILHINKIPLLKRNMVILYVRQKRKLIQTDRQHSEM